jgi:hypothetical protein
MNIPSSLPHTCSWSDRAGIFSVGITCAGGAHGVAEKIKTFTASADHFCFYPLIIDQTMLPDFRQNTCRANFVFGYDLTTMNGRSFCSNGQFHLPVLWPGSVSDTFENPTKSVNKTVAISNCLASAKRNSHIHAVVILSRRQAQKVNQQINTEYLQFFYIF